MSKKSKKTNIPTPSKPDPKLAKRWLGAKIKQSDTAVLEDEVSDSVTEDLQTVVETTENPSKDDSMFTDQLQNLLSEPLLNQETLDEILDQLREERNNLEQLSKQITEERIALNALKAKAENGFASNKQKALEKKGIELKQLEEQCHQKLEEQKQEASEFIEHQKATLRKREVALNRREKKLLEQEADLETKSANANAGFIEEQKIAIEQYLEQTTLAKKQLNPIHFENRSFIQASVTF